MKNRELYMVGDQGDSIYVNNATFTAAKQAAGTLLAVTDEVLQGKARNGIAIIRPPGHRCKADRAMGFCFLGNVPIACTHAIQKYGVQRYVSYYTLLRSTLPASPLVKALIDIPEPCCSSISFYSDEYPTTIFHVKFKGVKPDMHARIKTIVMETLQETLQSSMDMERLRNQVKNVICNSADKLENDPSEGLASAVILDHLYGGEDHSYLKTYTGLFEDLKSLREKDEDFWKDILKYYLEEPYVTVNSVPSLECMTELEATEKKRVEEQQAKLGKSRLEECEKEVADCIEFNEKNFDEVEAIIEALPEVNYADQMSFHTIHSHPEQTPGTRQNMDIILLWWRIKSD